MVLVVDSISKRYGVLPSDLMSRGSSFDVYVSDLALQYEQYQMRRASGVESATLTPDLSQEEMQAMIDRVRNRKK